MELHQYLPQIIVGFISALVVGIPSWLIAGFSLFKLKTERAKTIADTHKSDAEAGEIQNNAFLKLFGEFNQLRVSFVALTNQFTDKDKNLSNCERLLMRIGVTFRQFFDDLEVGCWEADAAGNRIYCNKAWCEMTGMSLSQAIGAGWHTCIHSDDLSRVLYTDDLSRVLYRDEAMMFEGATLQPVECRLINQKTQEVFKVKKTMFPIFNADGTIHRFYGKVVRL